MIQRTDGSDPESPSMTVGSMDGPTNTTNDLIIGEEIIGSISGINRLHICNKKNRYFDQLHL